MKKHQIVLYIGLLICFVSCNRVKYFPDKPIVNIKTCFIAHKGGGYFDAGNTLQGCMFGLEKLDGIECDVQRSSNNTLWLSHSQFLPACALYEAKCFASLTDKTIINVDSCLGNNKNYTKLEEVFEYMHNNYPNKYISIDVKVPTPCGISDINVTKEMNEIGQKIIDFTQKYNLQNKVMVESESGDFLYYVRTHTKSIETFLSTYGDFELGMTRALNGEFSGISFKYKYLETITREQVDLLHRKGLKIQLWTLNNANDINEAVLLNPDYIQTDYVNYICKNIYNN